MKKNRMKANGKFFSFTLTLNLILGVIGALIFWPIRALSHNNIIAFTVCGVIFTAVALYVNLFIVKRSKLKTPYFIFGTVIYLIALAGLTALIMLI